MPCYKYLTAILTLTALCLLSTGCGQRKATYQLPTVYYPQDFPDIPHPQGYAPLADSEQLAVALAGGGIRRLRITLQQIPQTRGPDRDELLDWYAEQLPNFGWQRRTDKATADEQARWQRQHPDGFSEELLLETGRAQMRPIIRLTLVPIASGT